VGRFRVIDLHARRRDLSKVTVPTRVIHGDADRILPIAATGLPLSKSV
jgi:non-heme chloroperoxidase